MLIQIDRSASVKYFLENNTMFLDKVTYTFEPFGEDKVCKSRCSNISHKSCDEMLPQCAYV